MNSLSKFFLACKQAGILPTRFVLVASVARQTVFLFEKSRSSWAAGRLYRLRGKFPCSTSRFGVGQTEGSNCTPLGLHRIAEKIGGGWPAGTAFKSRQVIGFTWRGMPAAK